MYSNGQTLRHKRTNELVRLAPSGGSDWAWNIGKNTTLIREDGSKFFDDIINYTHIEDELGRPYAKQPKEGQFVDESAKKYLISKREKMRMRKKKLLEWEAKVLKAMKEGEGQSFCTAGKEVHCPFADGSRSYLFGKFFLQRRKARPLYRYWNGIKKGFTDGPMVFHHTDGQVWMYDRSDTLYVMESASIHKNTGEE